MLTGEGEEDALKKLLNALKSEGYQFTADYPQNAQESECGENTANQAEQVEDASGDKHAGEDALDDTTQSTALHTVP